MSTHISNFGIFGRDLEMFADIRGFVPEVGDQFGDFAFDAEWKPDADEWAEYVQKCADELSAARESITTRNHWSQS